MEKICQYGGECDSIATHKITRYDGPHKGGRVLNVCPDHREAATNTAAQYVGGWGDAVTEVALLSSDPTRLDVIRDAALRMLHGNDYERPGSQLRALATALGVRHEDVEGLPDEYPDPNRVSYTAEAHRFFYENAGFSYDPKIETADEGRDRCAAALAHAEAYRAQADWSLEWEDDYDGQQADADTEWAEWPHYLLRLTDPDTDDLLGALGGIMLKDKGSPYGDDPYVRVVAAEVTLQAMREKGIVK